MAKIVVNNAVCTCTAGTATSTLTTSAQSKAKAEGKLVALVTDVTFAGVFGICAFRPNPPGPNLPCDFGGGLPNWAPGSGKCKCGGIKVLLASDTNTCPRGGTVSITNPNQTKVEGL